MNKCLLHCTTDVKNFCAAHNKWRSPGRGRTLLRFLWGNNDGQGNPSPRRLTTSAREPGILPRAKTSRPQENQVPRADGRADSIPTPPPARPPYSRLAFDCEGLATAPSSWGLLGSQSAFRFLILSRAPYAVGGPYGFRSARNVCSRLQFVQTNISLCFAKVLAAGSISLSCSSPPHMQCKEGGGSTRGRM